MNSFCSYLILFCVIPWLASEAIPIRNFSGSDSVDDTLTSGSSGEDVVDACIDKLNHLDVFPNDFGLMQRIAKVETNFGQNYGSASPGKGIWQISTSQMAYIQSNLLDSSISTALLRISSYYGAEFIDFVNFDLTIPFHSAITSRIYIALMLNSTSTPGSIADQGEWWTSHYHPGGDPITFLDTVTTYETTKECDSKKLDLWLLLDDSSSVGDAHFEIALDFVGKLSRKFTISPDHVRIGFSLYSTTTTTISKLNEHTDNIAFETAVNSTVHQRGRTFTGAAIDDVINNGFTVANGARPYSEGVPRVLVLLTDGYSSDDVTGPAARAQSAGVSVFAVGIGEGIRSDEIQTIASYPSSDSAYAVENYDDLVNALLERLSLQFCKISSFLSMTSTTGLTATSGNSGFLFAIIPTLTFETIQISSSNGQSGLVYFSSIPNPTSSLHVAKATITPGTSLILTVTANTPRILFRNSEEAKDITITGFDSTSTQIPLYISARSNEAGDLQLDFRILTTTEIPTTTNPPTTTTATPPITIPVPEPGNGLQWWAILAIIVGILFSLFILFTVILLAIGISRSSKYPSCTESFVFSLCACVVKSASY